MTKSPRKNVPDVGIELGAACMPSELASDRATAPGRRSISQQSIARKNSSDGKIEYIMASMLIVLLNVW